MTVFGALLQWARRRSAPAALSAFIGGDATGSVIGNVDTDAETFIGGDRTDSAIWNVTHKTRK